ncbi:hypothetical protein AMTRI_Chr08g167290 [Amborella trichopoda]
MSETSRTIYRALVNGCGGAIYRLVVCSMGSMAYGCWVGSFWYVLIIVNCFGSLRGIYTGCYIGAFGCIMVLATILSTDLYFSFLLHFVGWLAVRFLYAFGLEHMDGMR